MKQKVMNNEAVETLYSNIEQKNLVALVGENMSGKSSLIKEIRDYSANHHSIFVLHIDAPKNRIIFKHSNDQAIEIRIDDISDLFLKVFQAKTNLHNIDGCYEEIISHLNKSIKLFDKNIFIYCESADEKDKKKDIRRHIDKILKTYLGIKDTSEIDENQLSQWRDSIDTSINDTVTSLELSEKSTCHKKLFYIEYNKQQRRKITQVSSGLQILIILLFIGELIKSFHSDNLRFLLIIDEPESYLHPEWQKKFLSYLLSIRDNNIKVLFATHSQYMIPTDNLDCIGIVTRSDEQDISYKNIRDYIQEFSNSDVKANQINVLRPVEEALGFQFNIFSLPFLTVEGDEELAIFRKLQAKINTPNIFCIKGSSNITPWLQASRMNEHFKGVFLLDADVDIINKEISNIDNRLSLVASLEENFLFIGKSIYTFDQVYEKEYIKCEQKDYSDDIIWIHIWILSIAYIMEINSVISRLILSKSSLYKIKRYKIKGYVECLEDFIATNLFESEQEGYKYFFKLAKEVIEEFISTHSDLRVQKFELALDNFLEKENKDQNLHNMVSCITGRITHNNSNLNKDLHKKIKNRLKTKILDDTLRNRDLNKLGNLINIINQKFENL